MRRESDIIADREIQIAKLGQEVIKLEDTLRAALANNAPADIVLSCGCHYNGNIRMISCKEHTICHTAVNVYLSLGKATQRAMAGPEISHNKAGVPITTEPSNPPGIRFYMDGTEFFPFGPEPFGVLKLEIDDPFYPGSLGSPSTPLHIRAAPSEPTDEMVEAVLAESVCVSVLHPRLNGNELRIAVMKLLHAAFTVHTKQEE